MNSTYSEDTLELNRRHREKCLQLEKELTEQVAAFDRILSTFLEAKYSSFVMQQLNLLCRYVHKADLQPDFNFISLHLILSFTKTMISEKLVKMTEVSLHQQNKANKNNSAKTSDSSINLLQEEMIAFKKGIAVFVDKLKQLIKFVEMAKNVPLDDLYCQPSNSKDWETFKSITKFYEFAHEQASFENYKHVGTKLFCVMAGIGRNCGKIPKTMVEIDRYLDQAFRERDDNSIIKFNNAPDLTEDEMSAVNAGLVSRILMYMSNKNRGLEDASFFIANPDYTIIRLLFNVPEKNWVRFMRKAFQFEGIKVDYKHYHDPQVFSRYFEEDIPTDRPRNLKKGLKNFTVTKDMLLPENLTQKRNNVVRIRLVYHKKLKNVFSKLGSYLKNKVKANKKEQIPTGFTKTSLKTEKMVSRDFQEEEAFHLKQEEALNQKTKTIMVNKDDDKPVEVSENFYKEYRPSNIVGLSSDNFQKDLGLKPDETAKKPYVANERPNVEDNYHFSVPPKSEQAKFDSDFDPASLNEWLTGKELQEFETIIIHFHGGGFVAQSSSSHQVYLNQWANDLKVPIFSVDYRLAPGVKFPVPINDSISGYLWVLNYLKFVLQVNPRKIVAIGDSAGANLIKCLTTWCIINNVRKPDHLISFYPALSLSESSFTPSLLYSLNDFMLNYSALRMCTSCYLGKDHDPNSNFFVSPMLTPSSILKEFPPTDVFVSGKDPVCDSGVRFCLKAAKAGAKVKTHFLKHLSHGLLSLSTKSGLPEAMAFMHEAKSVIKSALESPALKQL